MPDAAAPFRRRETGTRDYNIFMERGVPYNAVLNAGCGGLTLITLTKMAASRGCRHSRETEAAVSQHCEAG